MQNQRYVIIYTVTCHEGVMKTSQGHFQLLIYTTYICSKMKLTYHIRTEDPKSILEYGINLY